MSRSSIAGVFIFLVATNALGAEGDCEERGVCTSTNQWKEYKINMGTLDRLPYWISWEEAWNAIVTAADTWNEKTNAAYFRVTGNTEMINPNCGDYSVVWVDNYCSGSTLAYNYVQTFPSGCTNEFEIAICQANANGYIPWRVGHSGWGSIDLVGVLTHEFEHSLDLDDNYGDDAAIIHGTYFGNGQRMREPYQYDLKCTHEISGHRTLQVRRLYQNFSGSISGPSSITGVYRVSKAAVGAYGAYWLYGFKAENYSGKTYMFRNSISNPKDLSIDRRYGMGPRIVSFHEDSKSYAVYSTYEEYDSDYFFLGTPQYDPYEFDSSHAVRYVVSSDGFYSVDGHDFLRHCLDMDHNGDDRDDLRCSSYRPVLSSSPVASAYDNWSSAQRTIVVWVDQDRDEGLGDDNRVSLSVGRASTSWLSEGLLAEPETVYDPSASDPIITYSTPGIACYAMHAYDYNDCVLVYNDSTEEKNRIKAITFYVAFDTSQDRYRIYNAEGPFVVDSSPNLTTGSAIAAWYHNSDGGKFWIAVKPTSSNQELMIYSSDDGSSWDFEQTVEPANVGPVATNYSTSYGNMFNYAQITYVW